MSQNKRPAENRNASDGAKEGPRAEAASPMQRFRALAKHLSRVTKDELSAEQHIASEQKKRGDKS